MGGIGLGVRELANNLTIQNISEIVACRHAHLRACHAWIVDEALGGLLSSPYRLAAVARFTCTIAKKTHISRHRSTATIDGEGERDATYAGR